MNPTITDVASEPLALDFSDHVHVAGELLTGFVNLNVALAQAQNIDTIVVKIRGSQKTWIQRGQTSWVEYVSLVKTDQKIWSSSNSHSDIGSPTLRLPFSFQLLENLIPSFHFHRFGRRGVTTYSIEVVGQRTGALQRNRRVGKVFPLVQAASAQETHAKTDLLEGWKGLWKTVKSSSEIRQGLWGGYSKVDVELEIPELESFPIATPIPFRLRIVTSTKPMERSELEKQLSEGKEVFPATPAAPSSISLQLDKKVRLRAQYIVRDNTRVDGSNLIPEDPAAYTFTNEKPEWISSLLEKGEMMGTWRRSVLLESSFMLSGVPSFKSKIISCEYILHLRIPFPGIGNDFKYDLPIILNSGAVCPAPSFDHVTSDPPPFSSAVMDLPPAYWDGEDYDWGGDEKKS